MALTDKLTSIANAIRNKTGLEDKLTLDQMVENVDGIDVMPETVILVDEDGNEYPAAFTDEIVEITATANDIRLGTTAITKDGIITGEKVIPAYHTTEGITIIPIGSEFSIYIPESDRYNYTKIQVIICPLNSTPDQSVAATMVAINNQVYAVESTESMGLLSVNHDTKRINFGITNDDTVPFVVRYFTYKEE